MAAPAKSAPTKRPAVRAAPAARPHVAAEPGIRDRVRKGLSEVRTTVLGAQLLLGFQYEALFKPRFLAVPAWRQDVALAALALLISALIMIVAPASFHHLCARGRSTRGQARFTTWMIALSLAPFALALGLSVDLALADELGAGGAAVAAGASSLAAAGLWYGNELLVKTPNPTRPRAAKSETVPLKDQVADILTETRIVLPGVQALLGFQLAAYLTDAFPKLTPSARAAHDVALGLLTISMLLLMTPAPFHRLAERGRDSERFVKVGAGLVLTALGALALALAADLYVATMIVTGAQGAAITAAAAAASLAFAVWFGWPLAQRTAAAR